MQPTPSRRWATAAAGLRCAGSGRAVSRGTASGRSSVSGARSSQTPPSTSIGPRGTGPVSHTGSVRAIGRAALSAVIVHGWRRPQRPSFTALPRASWLPVQVLSLRAIRARHGPTTGTDIAPERHPQVSRTLAGVHVVSQACAASQSRPAHRVGTAHICPAFAARFRLPGSMGSRTVRPGGSAASSG